jgi:hypothetical protein
MSIYSGFSTRNQEAQYNRLVENLIALLQAKVLQVLKSSPFNADQAWGQKFNLIYSAMKGLEVHKYLEPKLSESCSGIAKHFFSDDEQDSNFSQFLVEKNSRVKINESKKNFGKKKNLSFRVRGEKLQKPGVVSKYYGKLMNNFLTPKTNARKKNTTISVDTQEFWLIDDNIRMIEHE